MRSSSNSSAHAATTRTADGTTCPGESPEEDIAPPPPAPHPEEREPKQQRDRKAEAKSLQHLLYHAEYNEYCDACRLARMVRRQARRQHRDPETRPKNFGDLVNADYIVAQSNEAMGLTGERDG